MIGIARIYDNIEKTGTVRVLVDRLWPRGITKEAAAIDNWVKEIAPSEELRKWFSHEPSKFPEFKAKYRGEIFSNPAFASLVSICRKNNVLLLYAARDESNNNAVVLKECLEEALAGRLD